MTCEQYEFLASDALDGELCADEHRLLDAHFAQCQDCSERHEQMLALQQMLGSMPAAEPPVTQSHELFERVLDDQRSLLGRLHRLLPRPDLHLSSSTSTAGAVLALLVILAWSPDAPPPPPPAAPVELELPSETLLTVWESHAELIVASGTPLSLVELDAAGGPFAPVPSLHQTVQMFLYERIVVRG